MSFLEAHRPQYLDELLDFLRIPSLSSLPEHVQELAAAAF